MEKQMIIAIGVFFAAYGLIISEKIHRTVTALSAGVLLIILGVINQERAIQHIDFNTLGLLIGMMLIVAVTRETGLFTYLAIWSAKKVGGQPVQLLLVLSVITAGCSALLDNVTTVLLTVPVTLSITAQLKLSPYPFLITQILAANIGGTATLIGDPPNIMIGSAVPALDFMTFVYNLTLICALILIVTLVCLVFIYRKKLVTTPELQEKLMNLDENKQLHNIPLLRKCLLVMALTIGAFCFAHELQLETGTIALAGATVLLASSFGRAESQLEHIFHKVEWLTIFFFVGLFMLVGALVETGVIAIAAQKMVSFTTGNATATALLILWLSAIASAFIDNIPFVATMIPLIRQMGDLGVTNLEPLWWSLSLGACLGGNGTLVGASANLVVAGLAAQAGYPISFRQYFKIGFPLMILSMVMSTVYIYWRYLL